MKKKRILHVITTSRLRLFGAAAIAAAALTTGAWVVVRAQAPAAGTGTLSGSVIDATSRAPISGAAVSYSTDGNRTRITAQSDEAGRFSFTAVPAGRLFISAQGAGYVGGYYGVRHVFSANQYFEFDPGEKVTGVVLRMWAHASVAGRVVDESSKPVAGARIAAHRLEVVAGRLTIRPASNAQTVTANDQGEFQIGGLTPTSYVISAQSFSPEPLAEGRIYYPSARRESDSTIVELKSSELRTKLDITIPRMTSVPVDGLVDNRGTQVGLSVQLVVEPQITGITADFGSTTATVGPDGTFQFPHVAPGRYIARVLRIPRTSAAAGFRSITLTPGASGFGMSYRPGQEALPLAPVSAEPTLYADVPVTVGEEPVRGVRLVLQPAGRIRGRVVFTGNGDPPSADELSRSAVIVTTPGGRMLPAFDLGPIEPNLTFSTVGLPPGTYSLMVIPPQFSVQGAQDSWLTRWPNSRTTQDVQPLGAGLIQLGTVDTHVTMTFSSGPMAGIQGSVLDASGKTVPEASVFIAYADPRLWTAGAAAREVRPGRRGNYDASLVAGDYLVMASTSAPEFWNEADTLERLMRGATRVTLREGEKKSLDLRVPTGRRP